MAKSVNGVAKDATFAERTAQNGADEVKVNTSQRSSFAEVLIDRVDNSLANGSSPLLRELPASQPAINATYDDARAYGAANQLSLSMDMERRGHKDPRFMSEAQVLRKEYTLNPDARPYFISYTVREKEIENVNTETGEKVVSTVQLERPETRVVKVFNGQDIQGIPPYKELVLSTELQNRIVSELVRGQGFKMEESKEALRIAFDEEKKVMTVPTGTYKTAEDRNSAVMYALVGRRLDQMYPPKEGFAQYPELKSFRNELSHYLLAKEMGLPFRPQAMPEHTEGWRVHIRENKSNIFISANMAQKVASEINGINHGRERSQTQNVSRDKEQSRSRGIERE